MAKVGHISFDKLVTAFDFVLAMQADRIKPRLQVGDYARTSGMTCGEILPFFDNREKRKITLAFDGVDACLSIFGGETGLGELPWYSWQ